MSPIYAKDSTSTDPKSEGSEGSQEEDVLDLIKDIKSSFKLEKSLDV
jgi:hypothetical protein